MTWHFEAATHVAALLAEARSWRDTPFMRFSAAKGRHGGVDCVGFCEALLLAAGAVAPFSFPRSDADYSPHAHNDKILDYLRGQHPDPQSRTLAERFAELPVIEMDFVDPPMPGDLLVLKTGRGLWHLPVMLGPRRFIHCLPRLGVAEGNIDDPTYRKHLHAHFRARALPLLPS